MQGRGAFEAMTNQDVIIVGGGPVGIYLAIRLKEKNLKVLVVEKNKTIGIPRFCSGLISKEAYEKFDLPKNLIQNRLNSAWVFSPMEKRLYFKNRNIEVFVVNRTLLDQALYKKAKSKGVKFLLYHDCADVRIADDYAETDIISMEDKKMTRKRAPLCVLATGVNYRLHRRLGIEGPSSFLDWSALPWPGSRNWVASAPARWAAGGGSPCWVEQPWAAWPWDC